MESSPNRSSPQTRKPRRRKPEKGAATVGLGPALTLLPYQRRWVQDDSLLKIVVKARQVGYSFAATLRAVLKCLERKLTWVFLSKGERQSRLLMDKVQEHIQGCGIVARAFESTFFEGTTTRQLEVRFPNGSVIYGLPANPDTARGYTGNVTLDEFAFHQDAAKVYSALYPTITRGYSLELISTPNGQQGKYFEIAKAAGLVEKNQGGSLASPAAEPALRPLGPEGPGGWSGHKVDIYEAAEQGLARSLGKDTQEFLAELRAGCDDEETWLQEYCCEFLSDAQNYIPMELIMSCVSEEAQDLPLSEWSSRGPQSFALRRPEGSAFYLGVDIGRKRDLTVAWLFEKLGDVMWSRALIAMKGQTFEAQERAIWDLMEGVSPGERGVAPGGTGGEALVRRCCIDQSGLGMMLAERLAKKYGARVEPVQFTAQVKEKLAPLVKQHFEDRLVRIPDDREVRTDLNAVKRYVTPVGNVRFDAERSERGHADRFWALALALNAAAEPEAHFAATARIMGEPMARGRLAEVL